MEKETIFIDGMSIAKRTEKTPNFIKARLNINCTKFADFMRKHAKKGNKGDWWITVDIRESRGGVLYLALNDFEPRKEHGEQIEQPKQPKPTEETVAYFSGYSSSSAQHAKALGQVEQADIDVSKIPF